MSLFRDRDCLGPEDAANLELEIEREKAVANSPLFFDSIFLLLLSKRTYIGKKINDVRRVINGRAEYFLGALNDFKIPSTSILRLNLSLPGSKAPLSKNEKTSKNRTLPAPPTVSGVELTQLASGTCNDIAGW